MTRPHRAPDAGRHIETLARTYAPALKRFFERRVLEHADVDDLVQEVFLRLTRRGDLDEIFNLEGYIFQTAANILRDRLRHRFTHHVDSHEPISENEIEDAAFSPERVLQGKGALDRLSSAIVALPERTRVVFVCCRIEGLPYADVAARLGISLSAVNKHMAKAMDRLMDEMKDDLESWR